ncbi:GntP family permease [Kurthia sibirica]|uniref:Citrate transporter n=1 Tax=Kurthia sibirica TaxID=202750 RepID=A0A2U3AN22_9BACL|nr:GntP family permease [Kurthia sibirica]PWI25911.1 citrate transporter [Kurthia sibirica]GEK34266.1 cytochrome C biogenesis protein CcmE [Kurthia sibirica]
MWSLITIVISLTLLIVLALRGFSIIIIAPVVSLFVMVANGLPILETFQETYMGGFIGYVKNYFLIFLFAAMFGKMMDDSGAARQIANLLLRIIGKDSKYKVLVAIMIICAFLTYGGVSLFVVIFAVLPIAKPLFKELDIPWHLFMAPFFTGIGTFTMTMLPGTPSVQNIIPTKYLGTTVTAAPMLGIIAAVCVIALNLWYMKHALKRSEKRNETYLGMQNPDRDKMDIIEDVYKNRKLPNPFISLVPPVALLLTLNLFNFEIIYTLMGVVVLSSILFWNYIVAKKDTINLGATSAILPIINTSADVGYGSVIAITAGFSIFNDAMSGIPGSPIISLFIATTALAGITGSSSGGLAIAMEALSSTYLKLGLNPEAMHRVASVASGGLDSLPHNGGVITILVASKLTHKDAYKHIFVVSVIAPLLASIPMLIAAILFY